VSLSLITLCQALEDALQDPPYGLPGALAALPPVGSLPSPWVTWTLIGLVRHRRRQLEAAELINTRLRTLPGHPRSGLVPGLTDWEFDFHGRGCRLTHRGTGETLDVDFHELRGESIDFWFYVRYLQSLRHPEPPEERLIALHPSLEAIRLATQELQAAGALEPEERHPHAFRVGAAVLEHEPAIARLAALWALGTRRPLIAARLGDWPGADEACRALGESALAALCAPRAAACKERRCRELLELCPADETGDVLLALDDLDAPGLDEALARALERPGPCTGAVARALGILDRRGDAAWCPPLRLLFGRLDPGGELIDASLWVHCLGLLLRHDEHRDDLRLALREACGIAVAEAALLALEYAPECALELFRRALRSDIPRNRNTAAAALALVNRPWSRRALRTALEQSHDREATAACRAALRECPDPECRTALDAWENAHPPEPEPEAGQPVTGRQWVLSNSPTLVQAQMARLHDRVRALRDRTPPDSPE
jgi:hypothetical protein